MTNNLNRIPFLVRLSRTTSNIIKQNLIIGIGFIMLFEILAAGGYIWPVTAAVCLVVSSMLVVFNSARLVRSGEDIEHAEHEALRQREQQHPSSTARSTPEPTPSGEVTPATV